MSKINSPSTETSRAKRIELKNAIIEKILISKDIWIKLLIPVILIIVFSLSMLIVFRSTINYMNHQQVIIDTLKQGHQRSAGVFVELRLLCSHISYWELNGGTWNPLNDIKEIQKELEQIKAIGQAFDDKCYTSARVAINTLNNYRRCIQKKMSAGSVSTDSRAVCTREEFKIQPFKELISQYSDAIRNTVK